MAPIQSKPELPDSPAGATSQSPRSTTASAVDENNDDAVSNSHILARNASLAWNRFTFGLS